MPIKASKEEQVRGGGYAVQLAAAEREIAALRTAVGVLVDLFAVNDARLYCVEIANGLRDTGRLGIDGLRFDMGASKATLEQHKERIRDNIRREIGLEA